MTISAAIGKALQGLNLASKGTDVLAANIANAQTDGYVRREVESSERVVDGIALGLNPSTVTRNNSIEAVASVRKSHATYEQQKVIAGAMEDVIQVIGDVDSPFSLSARVDNLRASLKGLAETPENGALQDQTITDARLFADTIRSISTTIQDIRESADAEINREVARANIILTQLSNTAGDIISVGNSGDISGLQDEQERLLDELSAIIPIQITYNENGSVRVSTQTGNTLLDISKATLEFTPSTDISADEIYAHAGDAPGAPYNDVLSGLVINGVDVTSSAGKVYSFEGGRLGGLFKVRDEEMITVQRQIDNIAARTIEIFRDNDTSLADLHTNGTTDGVPDGNPDGDSIFTFETAGTIFTDIDDMLGVASSFKINPAIDPDQGGDKRRVRDGAEATAFNIAGNSSIVRAWINGTNSLQNFDSTTDLTGSQTIMSSIREFVSLASLRNQNEKNVLEFEEGKINTLIDERDNIQGVNLDEEMNDLVFLQKLYSANAIVLQRASEMLQTIIDIR